MHDLFWRQRTGALGLVRGYGTNCMRERGPARVRIGCARRPGSRASIDRPVAGTRWQSARTLHPRGQAHREKGPVRAEGAGAHLWHHLDNLQRLRRPRSRHPESLGCRPEVPAKYGLAEPPHLALNRSSSARFYAWRGMVSMHIRLGLAFRSPLPEPPHRALPNLEERPLSAMRSVA